MFTIVAGRGHGLIRQIIQKVFEFCNIIIIVAFEWDIISVAGNAHSMHMAVSIIFGYLSKVLLDKDISLCLTNNN